MLVSNCCWASEREEMYCDSDTGFCSDCKDHCEYAEICEDCWEEVCDCKEFL